MKRLLLGVLMIGLLAAVAAGMERPPVLNARVNPMGLFFNNSFGNITDYQQRGALLISGNCNRYDERFTAARAAGAEVLTYLNPVEVYDTMPCKLSREFYMDGRAPLWPYPEYGQRINWKKTHMADLRAGSEWSDAVVGYVEKLMREDKVDGVFLDVVGARLWSKLADWHGWPKAEQDAWTQGNIDLVRRLDEARRRINPRFLIINNNIWDRGDAMGFEGEKYVDGVVLQNPKLNEYHVKYAQRAFGDGSRRRVLIMARTPEDAVNWSRIAGITHVTEQQKYDHPGKPVIPYARIDTRIGP